MLCSAFKLLFMQVSPLKQFNNHTVKKQPAKTDVIPQPNTIQLAPIHLKHAPLILKRMSKDICQALNCLPINSIESAQNYILENSGKPHTRQGVFHLEFGLIGCAGYYLHTDQRQPHAFIYYWISAPYQRKGFASLAIEQLIHQLRQQGITQLYADVFDSNYASQNLLQSFGFKRQEKPVRLEPRIIFRFERKM
ncbi:putative Acyl-CoA N-acyltransferase [Vibrio nigripulchritudo SFn27]|nr:putative Acyl-CoA N-acyltransferase [Vibrio nigripulchritudo BLFn1]CCN91174.1 putative Acyl-CoA N-acyltransferase [Vibrio nigripulchritudo SFn27]CCN97481.1 putative Acyl-CoA N-acyltransferase [Vibrio nigripulchritudo ENn2]CCO40269.1 putative Acyl-CoA N-acyltransferase [Vibrio nigripulchritudo SFn135]CCO53195.1 putative Acyl-CoA N-acyltransferase [Vibrio nigripulchritudo Wn13]